jgi:RNA polymerase sigma-70 factor (ECF subfamily)
VSPILFKRLSDENLGSRLASGEAAAFDELYRRYAHRLAAYGSHLLGDAASGDDVAQAAMMKAYGALRDGRIPDKMKPWLYRIAHNAAIDLVARRRELSTETVPEQTAGEREPFAGALVEALATLPDRQRRVYVLREVHGLRIDETASELGLTASQVEQSLFAARNRLAEQLVFGDRLNCVTVQRLAAGPLDGTERRALKTHLRTCQDCRQSMGVRGRALSWFPSGASLEWLRGLGTGLIGGGAPVAAKVGAVFATATIVGGGTVAVEKSNHHAHRAALKVVPAAPVTHRPASVASSAIQVSALTAPLRKVVTEHKQGSGDDGSASRDSGSQEHEAQQIAEHDGSGSSGGSDGSDDSSKGDAEHTTTSETEHSHSQREGSGKSGEGSGKSSSGDKTETRPSEPAETHPTETEPTETEPTETHPSEDAPPPPPPTTTVEVVPPLPPVPPTP